MNPFVSQLLFAIPALLVGCVGLVLAMAKWNRHPQASLLITVGASLLMLATLGSTLFYGVIAPKLILAQGPAAAGSIYGIAGLAFTLLHQTSILLLILGAFANRTPPPLR